MSETTAVKLTSKIIAAMILPAIGWFLLNMYNTQKSLVKDFGEMRASVIDKTEAISRLSVLEIKLEYTIKEIERLRGDQMCRLDKRNPSG